MDHRMKLVKIELTKLVKADVEAVQEAVQVVRKEITEHVDQRVEQRVQVAEKDLSEHVDRRAQAVRKELQADVNLINQCIQQVERTVEAIQKDKPLAQMIKDASQAEPFDESLADCNQQGHLQKGKPPKTIDDEEFSPEDMRTRRVRDLLTKLV